MSASLAAYLDMLPDRPLLGREEEANLLKRARAVRAVRKDHDATDDPSSEQKMRDGDAAQAILAESFLHKIVKQARSMHERSGGRAALEDLVSAGNEGLVKAIERFDLARGTRFWTYAAWWVRNAMSMELRFWRWPLAISDHAYRNAIMIMGTTDDFWIQTGRAPSTEDLAAALSWDVERLQATLYQLSLNDVLSLDKPMGERGESTFVDFLVDEKGKYGVDPSLIDARHDSVSAEASLKALGDEVRGIVDTLTEREQEVLDLRFGLSSGIARTLSDVGEEMGVSGERARQIEESAFKHLREGPDAAWLERLAR